MLLKSLFQLNRDIFVELIKVVVQIYVLLYVKEDMIHSGNSLIPQNQVIFTLGNIEFKVLSIKWNKETCV